ncbi:MAG: twin-arginine translocase subunit TatC [Planctomycetota bacterium]
MDAISRPKDDLFDNSTMTFGEHLEELRQSLVKAIIWLMVGLAIGLLVANRVVRYIQQPLKEAIIAYNADRDIARLGLNQGEDVEASMRRFREFLMEQSLIAELVYEVPPAVSESMLPYIVRRGQQDDDSMSGEDAGISDESPADGDAESLSMVATMAALPVIPDPDELQPKVQFRRSERGLSSLKVEEPFMTWVKAGLIVGAVLASPMIFYHLWSFVAAGLHSHERRYVYVYLPFSVGLFVSGVLLAFYLVLQYVLNFLLAFNGSMDVAVEPRLTYYINFVLLLPLGFGVAFQLPLVMLFLQRIDLIQTQDFVNSWRVAVVVIFVISMLVTPADVTSMVALAVPLLLLYGLGILMCLYMPRGRGLGHNAYDPA